MPVDERPHLRPAPDTFASDNWAGLHPPQVTGPASPGRTTGPRSPPTGPTRGPPRPIASSGTLRRRMPTSTSPSTGRAPTWSGCSRCCGRSRRSSAPTVRTSTSTSAAPRSGSWAASSSRVSTPDGKLTPELVAVRWPASATSTTYRPRWSRSPRAPSSAPCTRSTRSPRWPSGPTPMTCWSTSTGPGSPMPPLPGRRLRCLRSAAGVDLLSFGGTKNGALGAEAVITFRASEDPRSASSASSRCSCRRRCASSPPSSWPC